MNIEKSTTLLFILQTNWLIGSSGYIIPQISDRKKIFRPDFNKNRFIACREVPIFFSNIKNFVTIHNVLCTKVTFPLTKGQFQPNNK